MTKKRLFWNMMTMIIAIGIFMIAANVIFVYCMWNFTEEDVIRIFGFWVIFFVAIYGVCELLFYGVRKYVTRWQNRIG